MKNKKETKSPTLIREYFQEFSEIVHGYDKPVITEEQFERATVLILSEFETYIKNRITEKYILTTKNETKDETFGL